MLVSTQQSISDLNEWKKYFSDLKNYFQTHGLTKKEVNDLCEVKNDRLPNIGIKINEHDDRRLRSILSNFNQDQNYRSNPDDCEFIVYLINAILKNIDIQHINTLQYEQDDLQQKLTPLKKSMIPLARIFTPTQHREYKDKKREFKNTVKNKWGAVIEKNKYALELIKEERSINFDDRIQKLKGHIKALEQDLNNLLKDKKILRSEEYDSTKEKLKSQLYEARKEKWQAVLDQKFQENENKPLDKVAKEIGSDYIKREIKKNNYISNYVYKRPDNGGVRSIGEILNRANPTYEDKQILLKWDIYQVETLLKKDKTLTEGDKKALKEISQDLKKEKDESKKDFDSKNEYIQKLREVRTELPQSIIEDLSATQERQLELVS